MNKLFILASLIILPLSARAAVTQFGRIVDIKGAGFVSYGGQTHEIKKGEVINVNSEIIIEHSGQVTFTDNADHQFHMGNASTAAVYVGKVELRSGDMWVQSINKTDDYQLVTANASVSYQGGEAILSYDSSKGKTQLMVINGLMKLSNLRSPELNLTVSEGNFSFVDMDFEEGMPRDPTPVGKKTYGELVALFPGVAPMDKHSAEIFKEKTAEAPAAKRSVASVEEPVAAQPKVAAEELEKEYKNEVMKLKKPAHVVTAAVKSEKKKTVKKLTPVTSKLEVKIYGLAGSEASATMAIYDIPAVVKEKKVEVLPVTSAGSRAPASVPETAVPEHTVLDQAVPKADNMNAIPTTPQYKESEKLLEQLNKL
jgi:hypothetical protein